MIKYENKLESIKIPISVVCDKCGTEYNFKDDWMETQEFTHINDIGGYGSVFGDGNSIRFDICQYCLYGWMKGVSDKEEILNICLQALEGILKELFNPDIGFVADKDERNCEFCPFGLMR